MRKGTVGFPEMLKIKVVANIFRIGGIVEGREQGFFTLRRRQMFYIL